MRLVQSVQKVDERFVLSKSPHFISFPLTSMNEAK